MKHFILALQFVTALAWLPLWLIKIGGRFFAALVIGAILAGCTSTSSRLDKSPCACYFKQINTGSYGSKADV